MNITNQDYLVLSAAVGLLDKVTTTPQDKLIVREAKSTLAKLEEKQKRINDRAAKYIREKRKIDPSYAGGKGK